MRAAIVPETPKRAPLRWQSVAAPVLTIAIFVLIFRKVPFEAFTDALRQANYAAFFTALLPFSVLYFALDTLVLWCVVLWFHPPRSTTSAPAKELGYSDLLPVRAVDYLLSILNHRVSQGALVVYLSRRLGAGLLELASTVLFLDFMQKSHLILWASIGMVLVFGEVPAALWFVPLVTVAFWGLFLGYVRGRFAFLGRWFRAPDFRLLRTFRLATRREYVLVLLLKAPLLLLAVAAHGFAIRAFGFEIPAARLLATLPIIFLVGALPVNVARLGTTPLAWIFFHGDIVPAPQLLAYSLAGHLTFMLANAAYGLVFLPRAYRELFGTPLSGNAMGRSASQAEA